VPTAFKFAESFSKPATLALASIQSGCNCAAHFSKDNCSSETYLAGLKTGKIGAGQFSKAQGATTENLSSERNTAFELAVLKILQQLSAQNG
jgi:hypothetical protein